MEIKRGPKGKKTTLGKLSDTSSEVGAVMNTTIDNLKVGDTVMHNQTRYLGKIERIDLDWPTSHRVLVKWNLGFSDRYPADWLEKQQ